MRMRSALCAILALACTSAAPSQAAVFCTAEFDDLVLGQVSLRQGFAGTTFGRVLMSCSGGEAGATVQACLRVGAGSGGAAAGLSPRFMRGAQMDSLDFQLTTGAASSAGGTLLDSLDLAFDLDATGAGAIGPAIYAEALGTGGTAGAGRYDSSFSGGTDIAFSYGETSCTRSGEVDGFTVSAEVAASCTVEATPMDFGMSNGAIDAPLDATASVSVSCTNGATYSIGLDGGLSPQGPDRGMASGASVLRYGLFHDAGASEPWGTGAATTALGSGSGTTQHLTVFGRVYEGQTAATGIYTDRVVIVVTY